MAKKLTYDAFISYYQNPDKQIAIAVEKALRELGTQWYLLKFRALTIFRDETGTSGPDSLEKKIIKGIESSDYLILLASKQGKENCLTQVEKKENWVEEESKMWLERKPKELVDRNNTQNPKIIICITDGTIKWDKEATDFDWTITNCLPICLKGQFPERPQWIDLREIKQKSIAHPSSLSLEFPEFKLKAAGISSQIQDITVDALIAKDKDYKRIGRFLIIIIFAFLVGLTIFAFSQRMEAIRQKKEADNERNEALKNLRSYEFERLKEAIRNAQIFIDAKGYGLDIAKEELKEADKLIQKYKFNTLFTKKQKDVNRLNNLLK